MLRSFLHKLRRFSVFSGDHHRRDRRPPDIEMFLSFSEEEDEWVRVMDENLYEDFTVLSWIRENDRLQITRQEEGSKDNPPPPEPRTATNRFNLTQKEWENLYVEVLYTIRHKLGANSSNYAAYTEDMYEYARETFHMSRRDHAKFMGVAEEEKPPIPVLNVTVVEAQGLEAKDPNGFSDPYCMLGVQTDPEAESRKKLEVEEESGSRMSLKRFGASFKKKEKREPRIIAEDLPAKLIRATSVKKSTLEPKWREKFRLDIDDARTDRLHLDVWDHDDETSVIDAAKKLNEVASLKGLGRYFKEIAQSARSSIGDNVDDFLGCINVSLEEVCAAGIDRWFMLQGRSNRSNVQGQIHLKLQLGTREDRGLAAGEDNWREVVEHQHLIWVFVDHELSQFEGESYEWAGDLPQQALTILHQHAIQGDITELQQAVCQWIAYFRKHREVPLDYALLHQQLEEMALIWNKNEEALSIDEETSLAETFGEFVNHCFELLRHHRKIFPSYNVHAWHKLKFILKCLSFLHSMAIFKMCFPFRNELHVEISNILKKGTMEWMADIREKIRGELDNEDNIFSLVRLLDQLNMDLQKAITHYHHLFDSTVNVNYFTLTYKIMEKQLVDEITGRLDKQDFLWDEVDPSEIGGSENALSMPNRAYINRYLSQMAETDVFVLLGALQEFNNNSQHLSDEKRPETIISSCYIWFSDIVHRWFSVATPKIRSRVYNAIDRDRELISCRSFKRDQCSVKNATQNLFQKVELKYSSSAVDSVMAFVQLREFWLQVCWPKSDSAYPYILFMAQAVSSGVILYCNLLRRRVRDDSKCFDSYGYLELTDKVILFVNNMEYVLSGLFKFEREMNIEVLLEPLEDQDGVRYAEDYKMEIESLLYDAQQYMEQTIYFILDSLVDRRRPFVKKFMFHLAWAPDKLEADKCLTPLLDYLENTFEDMNFSYLDENYRRSLKLLWRQILSEMTVVLRANIGKEKPIFFERLHTSLLILVEFFYRDGSVIPISEIQDSLYQELKKELKLHKTATNDLIQQFYIQRMMEQNHMHDAPFGVLTVNAYYDENNQNICVEVISARNLIPCDPNGLSDPFVIVELTPKYLFPTHSVYKTKVHMRTLTPTFHECFEWSVPREMCRESAAVAAINFVVMDFDYMRKNDFEGEAYLTLSSLPGTTEERTPEPLDLILIGHSKIDDIQSTLSSRGYDKIAADFLRQEKNKYS